MKRIAKRLICGTALLGIAVATPPLQAFGDASASPGLRPASPVVLRRASYHGWDDALHLSNGIVEATVVPGVGRIMQFGYAGTGGVFWQDRSKDGQSPNLAPGSAYKNFGGDKVWPAPQSDWPKVIKGQRGPWPPPTHFELMSSGGSEAGTEVVMASAVDPHYGIRTTRRIRLVPGEPRMHVTTTFEQVGGTTNQVAIWVVSHFADPEKVFVPVAENSIFPGGYRSIYSTPPDLAVSNNLISFTHRVKGNKIGTDGGRILGLGTEYSLEISAPRVPGVAYPDSGSSVEVYTADGYVELEMLGALSQLLPGESISLGINYTLHTRVLEDPQLEAERILRNEP